MGGGDRRIMGPNQPGKKTTMRPHFSGKSGYSDFNDSGKHKIGGL
jgi:hypothetical protein